MLFLRKVTKFYLVIRHRYIYDKSSGETKDDNKEQGTIMKRFIVSYCYKNPESGKLEGGALVIKADSCSVAEVEAAEQMELHYPNTGGYLLGYPKELSESKELDDLEKSQSIASESTSIKGNLENPTVVTWDSNHYVPDHLG